jgi:hypothetical protein
MNLRNALSGLLTGYGKAYLDNEALIRDNEVKAKAYKEAEIMANEMNEKNKVKLRESFGYQRPELSEAYNLVKQLHQYKSSFDPNLDATAENNKIAISGANNTRNRFKQLGFTDDIFKSLGFNPDQDIISDDNLIKNTISNVYLNQLLGLNSVPQNSSSNVKLDFKPSIVEWLRQQKK